MFFSHEMFAVARLASLIRMKFVDDVAKPVGGK